ncbi:MAG TPA: tetratricopeptide repeat protein, partial [Terrimicrobiaceae bacterium]
MQTTASLWEMLCRDFESERRNAGSDQYGQIALRFLQAAKRILRSSSPRLGDAFEIAGDACQAVGDLVSAAARFNEALSQARQWGTPASAARLAAKAAIMHDGIGNAAEARLRYGESLTLYDQIHDYSQHVMLLSRLGALCKNAGDFEEMEKSYQRAMEVAIRLHDQNHPEVAAAANNLGVAYTEMRQFPKAESFHIQALAIREKCFGTMHPEVAQSMANLAVVYHATGNHQKALAFYAGALEIYCRFRGEDDPEMRTVITNRDALCLRIGY